MREDDGAEKSIFVRGTSCSTRLWQTRHVAGDLVNIPTHMHKIVVKLPFLFGLRPEACNSRTIAKFREQHIPAPAYENITVRQDQSATVFAHESEIETLLRASGLEAVFLKLHETSSLLPDADTLWMLLNLHWIDASQWRKVMTPHLELSQRIAR